LGQTEEIAVVCDYFYKRADQHPEELANPSRTWVALSNAYMSLGNDERGNTCAQHAYARDPEVFAVRLLVAKCLLRSKRFAEAEQHLRWCTARKPDARGLHDLLRQAVTGRIARPTRTSAMALPESSIPSQPR
jgi:predicted Zn-dependent protease